MTKSPVLPYTSSPSPFCVTIFSSRRISGYKKVRQSESEKFQSNTNFQMKRRRTTQGSKGVAKTRRTQTSLITPKLNPSFKGSSNKQSNWKSGEHKALDTHYPMTAVGTGMTMVLPTTVATTSGTGLNQRVGIQVNGTKLHVRGLLRKNQISLQTLAENVDSIRIMVILDKQANGASPSFDDILFAPTTGDTSKFLAFNNLRAAQRFTVLKDSIFRLQRETLAASPTAPLNTVYSMAVERYFAFHIDFRAYQFYTIVLVQELHL